MERLAAFVAAPFILAGVLIVAAWAWSMLRTGEPIDPRPHDDDFTV